MLDFVSLVAITAALISCCAAVFSVWFVRRGGDAELKTDVEELALLVDRMAKTQRREKMARVRRASEDTGTPTPAVPSDYPEDAKTALRRQVAASQAARFRR